MSLILRNWLKSTGKPNNKTVLYNKLKSLCAIPATQPIKPIKNNILSIFFVNTIPFVKRLSRMKKETNISEKRMIIKETLLPIMIDRIADNRPFIG